MAISRKPISIKDVAFRTSFGLGPEKTENQGQNRERKAGRWGESMVQRGASERCETGANPLETRGKRKPVTPENDPRETGLSFLNGGGAGNRTRVRRSSTKGVYMLIPVFVLAARSSTGRDIRLAILLYFRFGATGAPLGYPTEMTICPSPWERVGRSLAELSC